MQSLLKIIGSSRDEAVEGYTLERLLSLQDPMSEIDDYYVKNLMRKNIGLCQEDFEAKTLQAFFEGEQRAALYGSEFQTIITRSPRMSELMQRWRFETRRIMGACKIGTFGITSGATTSCPRGNRPYDRFRKAECSYELDAFIRSDDGKVLTHDDSGLRETPWVSYALCPGSNCVVVPKNATVGRLVCPEPAVNAYYQSGIRNTLVQRLLRTGINISQAPERHKRLAKFASIRNHLTTDDETNASGLIHEPLVKYLCSEDWFTVLSATRSHYTVVEEHPVWGGRMPYSLKQFATMGNGFCFELETIIFLAMIRAVVPRGQWDNVSVFGDDLIYPSEYTQTVRALGNNVGFINNVDKSFHDSPFRESCGGDYLDGQDIRPVFFKNGDTDDATLTTLANQLFRFGLTRESRAMLRVWYKVFRLIKRKLIGPLDYCLIGPRTRAWNTVQSSSGPSGKQTILTWVKEPQKYWSLEKQKLDDYALSLASAGLMKDMGYRHRQKRDGTWFCEYRPYPAAGTPYVWKIQRKGLYLRPNLVDETDPLSVFKILPLTNAPKRLQLGYDYKTQEVYDRKERYVLLRDLLGAILEKRKNLTVCSGMTTQFQEL